MGAINEVDESYRAMITGCMEAGEFDWIGYAIELWIMDTMEVFDYTFYFGTNPLSAFDQSEDDIKEYSTIPKGSELLCALLGLDPKQIFNSTIYPHSYSIPEDKIKGQEIGISIGERYGERVITGFHAVSELSTMATVD